MLFHPGRTRGRNGLWKLAEKASLAWDVILGLWREDSQKPEKVIRI
jgi:hypothetical protein